MLATIRLNDLEGKMDDTINPIKELISKAANEFAKEFEECRILFKDEDARNKLIHGGEFGGYRERIVSNLIRKFLPKHLAMGEGFVVNTEATKTKQVDIIVYDFENTPELESAGARFYPYETVVALGEVKSTLNATTLETALEVMRANKKIRECVPHNPFPIRPAGLSEAILHHLSTVTPEVFNEWGDFKHIMDALFDFKKEGASTTPGALNKHKELIYNPRYFEELNVVTFLVCDEIENFSQKTDHQLKDMLFTRNVDIEHLGFNLILSVKDGLILHCGFSGGHQIATPYPKLRNTKSTIFVKTPINSDNSHIVTFVSMLLHAISSTAVFEFSPVPYIEQLMHDLEKDPSMRRIIE